MIKSFEKLHDHCYFTGKYRGGAYGICNLKFNVPDEKLAVL